MIRFQTPPVPRGPVAFFRGSELRWADWASGATVNSMRSGDSPSSPSNKNHTPRRRIARRGSCLRGSGSCQEGKRSKPTARKCRERLLDESSIHKSSSIPKVSLRQKPSWRRPRAVFRGSLDAAGWLGSSRSFRTYHRPQPILSVLGWLRRRSEAAMPVFRQRTAGVKDEVQHTAVSRR